MKRLSSQYSVQTAFISSMQFHFRKQPCLVIGRGHRRYEQFLDRRRRSTWLRRYQRHCLYLFQTSNSRSGTSQIQTRGQGCPGCGAICIRWRRGPAPPPTTSRRRASTPSRWPPYRGSSVARKTACPNSRSYQNLIFRVSRVSRRIRFSFRPKKTMNAIKHLDS